MFTRFVEDDVQPRVSQKLGHGEEAVLFEDVGDHGRRGRRGLGERGPGRTVVGVLGIPRGRGPPRTFLFCRRSRSRRFPVSLGFQCDVWLLCWRPKRNILYLFIQTYKFYLALNVKLSNLRFEKNLVFFIRYRIFTLTIHIIFTQSRNVDLSCMGMGTSLSVWRVGSEATRTSVLVWTGRIQRT